MDSFIVIVKTLFRSRIDSRKACAAGVIHDLATKKAEGYWLCKSDDGESGLYDAIWSASQGQIPANMTIGDIDAVLVAIDKSIREIGKELRLSLTSNTLLYDGIEKRLKEQAIENAIIQMQNELVKFYLKCAMHESQAHEFASTAKGMADYLNSLALAPVGWIIRPGPYGKDDAKTIRLEVFAAGSQAEAVWAERIGGNS